MFQKVGAICNQSVMSHTIAILTNICTDSVIRLKLMNCDGIWLFCVNILVSETPLEEAKSLNTAYLVNNFKPTICQYLYN